MKILTSIFLMLFAVGLVEPQNRGVRQRAESITGDQFPVSIQTPKGAMVYAVRHPDRRTLDAVDRGLTDLFAVARINGYSSRLNFNEYNIYIARADRTRDSSGAYSPDITVGAGQYKGSIYDQGGYIYAAGLVLAYSPMAFVIAEHTHDFDRIANVVRYEGEHLVLYHNDRRRFHATADHSKGGGHPILR
jgi:hypothetical protein